MVLEQDYGDKGRSSLRHEPHITGKFHRNVVAD